MNGLTTQSPGDREKDPRMDQAFFERAPEKIHYTLLIEQIPEISKLVQKSLPYFPAWPFRATDRMVS
jgi:hypothetical protein